MVLAGEKVRLRTLEAEDVDLLYAWENDPHVWQYGDCGFEPGDAIVATAAAGDGERFSREALRGFIENQQYDIYRTRQMRLVISRSWDDVSSSSRMAVNTNVIPPDIPVGFIDLFDFDPVNLRAGVGILICDDMERHKGYAREALSLVCDYAARILGLHQVWCSVEADNFPSIGLFRGADFVETGVRREWTRRGDAWQNEVVFQRIF